MKDQESRLTEAGRKSLRIERRLEEAEAPLASRQDPASQVSCRVGDASCAGAHAATLHRSTASRISRARDSLLNLQRQYGNRYLQRVLSVARQSAGEGEVAPEIERAIDGKRGNGQALDGKVRGQMESAFGADFGGVRVHTDAEADVLNQSLNARAFTTGSDIFFRRGTYRPGSSAGRELLAHELTHVVQQRGTELHTKLTVGSPGDHLEQEAESVARAVTSSGLDSAGEDSDGRSLRRQAESEEEEETVRACPTSGRGERRGGSSE